MVWYLCNFESGNPLTIPCFLADKGIRVQCDPAETIESKSTHFATPYKAINARRSRSKSTQQVSARLVLSRYYEIRVRSTVIGGMSFNAHFRVIDS